MRFRARILLALLCVGIGPLVLAGWLAYRANRDELLATVRRAQAQAAEDLARECEQFVLGAVEHVDASARYLPLDAAPGQSLRDVLWVPYRQLRWVNLLVLLAENGSALAAPVFEAAPAGRDPIGATEIDAFSRNIPLATALDHGRAVGKPYLGLASGIPRVAVAVRVDGRARRVLAAEVSLRDVAARLEELSSAGDVAFLVDERGRVVAHGVDGATLSRDERDLAERGGSAWQAVVRGDGERWLAAMSPVGSLGWGVVLARPEAVALRAAERVRAYTSFWAAAAIVTALALAWLLARGLTRPIATLSGAARALTEGRYVGPVAVARRDELGEFAAAFDHMASEVARRDEEIRAFNADLARRVEQKAAALKAAHDQIDRSRRLAAVGSLSAGVAHEINNPLAAVIGIMSIARKEVGSGTKIGQLLTTALEQATRVARVVEHLREISERQQLGPGVRFSLATPVRSALDAQADKIRERKLEVRTELDDGVPQVQGDPVQIQQLVGHLVENAIDATPDGGRLSVSVAALDGEAVRLSVADTGCGIPQRARERIFDPFFTSKERSSLGLGLTLSNCIVEAHHGKLLVESEEGKGSTFTVILPAAAAQAHLV